MIGRELEVAHAMKRIAKLTAATTEALAGRDGVWGERIAVTFHHLSRTPRKRPDEGKTTGRGWEERRQAFDLTLLAACGSAILVEICGDLIDKAQRNRFVAVASHSNRSTLEVHRGVMKAALDGEPGLASQRLVAHDRTTLRHIEEHISPLSTIGTDPPTLA